MSRLEGLEPSICLGGVGVVLGMAQAPLFRGTGT